jgi:hypothetical protein
MIARVVDGDAPVLLHRQPVFVGLCGINYSFVVVLSKTLSSVSPDVAAAGVGVHVQLEPSRGMWAERQDLLD